MTPGRGPLRIALFGHPVGHSRSRELFEAVGRAGGPEIVYEPVDVRPGDLATAFARLAAGEWDGANVTVPHKRDAFRLCSRLAPAAEAAGAVNVLARDAGGVITGHNTDGAGFLDAVDEVLAAAGRSLPGHAALLGCGGAAAGVAAALAGRGITLMAVSRTPARVPAPMATLAVRLLAWDDPGLARAVRACGLVVQATPLGTARAGMAPEDVPLPDEALGSDQLVVDLVYNPWCTPFLARARRLGARGLNGWPMLVHQAARALDLWQGQGSGRWVHEAARRGEARDPLAPR